MGPGSLGVFDLSMTTWDAVSGHEFQFTQARIHATDDIQIVACSQALDEAALPPRAPNRVDVPGDGTPVGVNKAPLARNCQGKNRCHCHHGINSQGSHKHPGVVVLE